MKPFAAALLALLIPAVANACAVCGFGPDPRRAPFFWTMVLLSLLPLGIVGGLIALFRRAFAAGDFADPDAPRAPFETPSSD